MITDVIPFVVFFSAGALTGFLWREALELIRGREPFEMLAKYSVSYLAIALCVSLVLTSIVGAMVVLNENKRENLIDCFVRYNDITGAARAERSEAYADVLKANILRVDGDISYQQGLYDSLGSDATIPDLKKVIQDRIDESKAYKKDLQKFARVRRNNEYPPSDMCDD